MTQTESDNVLVRYSRAGDAFHYRWAARRCLKLIDPKSALKYITIESSTESKAAGEYTIDMAEYSQSESGDNLVGYRQLKHSTVRTNRPFVYSDIKDTFAGFARRYSACLIDKKAKFGKDAVTFAFVSNRPVSPRIKHAIDRIRTGKAAKNRLQRDLQSITKLKSDHLRAFYQSLSISDAEGDYIVQKKVLQGEMEEYIAGFVDSGEVDQLIALVSDRALPKSESRRKNGEIWREDVLQRLGVTSTGQLFPAPTEFEKLPLIIKREQHESLLKHIQQHKNTTIVHAAGGVGKSVVARQLAESLPAGSVGIVYDCFGAGKYRNPSEPRHRAQDALVQITNELAMRGLCRPLICRLGTQPDMIFRSFRNRLQQALEKLREVNPAALLVILIDAADNAEMAARESSDRSFAGPLLLEGVPTGCRLTMFCRTERTELLAPPSSAHLFPLNGFSKNESGAHLRQHYPAATDHDVLEFHRLSGGNPRVQAYSLNTSGQNLSAVLTSLGPTRTTVDDQIYDQLQTAVAGLKDKIGAHFKPQVDSICRGLANLPPFIPLEVLAAAAAVDVSAIKSFVSDLGRPLWQSDDSVQFRDEPTETWFRKTFAADKTQISSYVSILEPLAKKYPYVAKVLPQLLLRSENYQKLVDLALSNDFLPENNPIDARNIRVYRLQYAFKAAIKLHRLADATRLAFRAGEEVAGNQRQLELLQANIDLITPLQDVGRVEELAHRQVFEGDWPGSQNLYSASLLSSVKDFQGEARSFLRAADKWLRIYFEARDQYKEDHPEASRFREQLTDAQISEFVWTNYNLYGTEQAVKYMTTWKPPMVIFQTTRHLIQRLVTAAKFEDIDRIAEFGAKSPPQILALAGELAAVAKFPPKKSLEHTLNYLNDPQTRLPKPNFVSFNDPLPAAIMSFAEACAAQGLSKEKILGLLNFYTEPVAHRSISSSFNHADRQAFFRGVALKAVLRGDCKPNPQALLPMRDPKQKTVHSSDREDTELLQVVNALLPWYVLRARFITGDATTNETDLAQLFAATENEIERGYRRTDGINYEIAAVYFEVLAFKKTANNAELDSFANAVARKISPKITLMDCLRAAFVSFRLPHLAALREHLEQNCSAAIEAPGTDGPETRAQSYIDLARAVLPVSQADARAHFNQAIEAVSKFGDEMVERWEAIVAVAKQAGKGSKVLPELCYRFIRCGEMVGETVAREKYWNRNEVFRTAIHLDASGSFAALSRWRDRQVGWFGDQLEALATEAVNSGILAPGVGWCLSAFEECNGSPQLAASCIYREKDSAKQQYFLDIATRDNMLKDVRMENWEELSALASKYHLKSGNINEWAAASTRAYPRHVPHSPSSPAEQNHPPEACNWEKLFANINLLTSPGQNAVINSFIGLQSASTLVDFWNELISRVPHGKEVDFLDALIANEGIDIYEVERAIVVVSKLWSQKAGIKQYWPTFLKQLGRRFASLLVNDYHLKSLTTTGCMTGKDAEMLQNAAFETFANSQDLIDASTFFGFARQFSKRLTEAEAEQLLEFSLARFELHIPENFADGLWGKWLETPGTPSEGMTGLIWSALGSPYAAVRWEAAHCVRRLAENSCWREIDSLVGWMAKGKVEAFGNQHFPFYNLHAKLYLLIALARVAVDSTNSVKRHFQAFADIALTGTPHLLIQKTSAEIALRIEGRHPGTYTATAKAKLKKAGKSPFPPIKVKEHRDLLVTPWHTAGSINTNLKLHFAYDFDRYWFEPLGRIFGVSQANVMELARNIAVNELHIPESGEYWRDPRQEQWNRLEQHGSGGTWSDHGSYPRIDGYGFYYSYHALMVTAARLISKMPVIHETRYSSDGNELAGWVGRHLLVRHDGCWLADRRDPAPIKRRDWIKKGTGKDWMWEVNADDFFDCLFNQSPAPSFLCVGGDWSDHSGSFLETINIYSALVNPDTARSLATAMRTSDNPWGLPYLSSSHHNMDFIKPLFQLNAWLQPPGETSGRLDTFDPYAKDISYPPYKVASPIASLLKLATDLECRQWKKPNKNTPSLISESWSTRELPRSREWEEPFRSGSRISASVQLLKELCAKTEKSLIFTVHIGRREHRRHHSPEEEDLGYLQPSHKIFIFSSNGKLQDARKDYQLG